MGMKTEKNTIMPRPWLDHCMLNEAYNLQATRPHLGWHFQLIEQLVKRGEIIRVVHWPGRPKPWKLGPGQRTDFEEYWWKLQADLCGESEDDHDSTKSRQCLLRCGR